MQVGQPVATSSEGIPFAPGVADALGWRLQHTINGGQWEAIKQRSAPADICAARESRELKGQVRMSDMIGQTTVLVGFALVAALGGAVLQWFDRGRAVDAVSVPGGQVNYAAIVDQGIHRAVERSRRERRPPPRPSLRHRISSGLGLGRWSGAAPADSRDDTVHTVTI